MKLAYFVHDLTDPAVTRRVRMLKAAGVEPVVLGFRRADAAPAEIAGAPAIDLGRTYDARLGHRAKATVLAAIRSGQWRDLLAGSEVIMARTLEMLAVADTARRTCGLSGPLVYECLDIHRLMLSQGAKGKVMRSVERALMRRSDLLIVSSPAFLEAYFQPVQGVGSTLPIETLLMENKVLELGGAQAAKRPSPPAGPPWRIGWMGAIRCRKSLDILSRLAAKRPDLVEVAIHGRPAYVEFDDFDGQVAALPNMSFGGAYTAADLARLYGDVHFSWAIDYMEEGQNSSWLLPNRVYESGRFGATPIALAGVQTGRFLAEHGFGVRLNDPDELETFLERLTPEGYAQLRAQLDAVPVETFSAGEGECLKLAERLKPGGVHHGADPQQQPSYRAKLVA